MTSRNQIRLEISSTTPFAGGGAFGNTGAYERLLGKAHYAIDPDEDGLPDIVDLELAPRNADGLVEFSATVDIIKPVDLNKGNNRTGADMTSPAYAGDGFLMRQGYTLMWSGWQGDLIDQGSNVVANLPFAL